MHRRTMLSLVSGAALAAAARGASAAASPRPAADTRLAAAWRGASRDDPQQVGLIGIDWQRGEVSLQAATPVPSRAHGLVAEPGGGWLAVAFRPGAWLWRFGADGRPVQRVSAADEPGGRRFSGHVVRSPDGATVLTTEYDLRTGDGLIGVRDTATLRKLDEWPSGGVDPHQLLFDAKGDVIVANGGLLRTADGRKRDLDRMVSSLVRLDGRRGALLGRWQPDDRRLGLRHLAWSDPRDGGPALLGIAMQAEHDDPAQRARAPLLAVWDGDRLEIPVPEGVGEGYAGDICAAQDGFVLSCQPARIAVAWNRHAPSTMPVVARMQEACALSPVSAVDGGVVVAGARGVGRWHPDRPAVMLPWPRAIALDNHWIELGAPA
jgi:hypothetical protein